MSVGYSFLALRGGSSLGNGIVSFGWTGGSAQELAAIVVCLDGNVRVSVTNDGLVLTTAVVSGDARHFPTVTGAIRGRC